jgi:hypothetical protein
MQAVIGSGILIVKRLLGQRKAKRSAHGGSDRNQGDSPARARAKKMCASLPSAKPAMRTGLIALGKATGAP